MQGRRLCVMGRILDVRMGVDESLRDAKTRRTATRRIAPWLQGFGGTPWALGLVFGLLGAVRADVALVTDGVPVADIVVSTNALSSVKWAAADVQTYIARISGATLPITHTPSDNMKYHVYVGPGEHTRALGVTADDLGPEEFRIVVRDNFVALIGRDEQRLPELYPVRGPDPAKAKAAWRAYAGDQSDPPSRGAGLFNARLGIHTADATATLYAAAEFLEQLGVRWYHPYEHGTVIPSSKQVVATGQDTRKAPKFALRSFNFYKTMQTDTNGLAWFKRLKYGASYAYYHHAHSTRDLLTPEQEQAHPEYYAMAEGKRIAGRDNDGVPRLMEPGFRKAAVNYMRKGLDAYPELKTFSLGLPDGLTQIDERDAKVWSRPDKGPNGVFSDYVWDFWLHAAAELKQSHPGKYLTCYSYTTYTEPTSQVEKLPDNVALFMSYGTGLSMLPGYKYYKDVRDRWLSMLTSRKLFLYEFCLWYRKNAPTCPVVFTKIMQEDMRKLNGLCEGKDIEIMPLPTEQGMRLAYPGLTHMQHYLQGKLYWDPDLDLQKLLDEYYALYYGPAQAEMKAFWEFGEEVWTRAETRSITIVGGFLKEKDVDRYFELLKAARAKAGKDTIYDRRIAEIEAEMEPLKKLFPNLQRSGPDIRCYESRHPVTIDGSLKKPFWTEPDFGWNALRDLVTGQPMPSLNATRVAFRLTPDKTALVVGVECLETKMDRIIANTTLNDDVAIFNDDVIEIYIETPERSYFKIAVNPNGAVWDESNDATIVSRDTLPLLWNPGIRTAVRKGPDGWSVEIMIPTKDFGALGPRKPYPWGINVCRLRHAGGAPEASALSPTGKMTFGVLTKLANLYVE